MVLVGESRGRDEETDLVREWQTRRDLFPHVPERSRFNRRRRALAPASNERRRVTLRLLDRAQERQGASDSLPVPALPFQPVPSSSAVGHWTEHGAAFGKVTTKQQTIFGYTLQLLVTLNGVILDCLLAPANGNDLEAGAELLATTGITLLTVPRTNQRLQLPPALAALQTRWRQIVATVNGQLASLFPIEENHAHSFDGLTARLYSKLTAHTLALDLNRLLGAADRLQLKALACPNEHKGRVAIPVASSRSAEANPSHRFASLPGVGAFTRPPCDRRAPAPRVGQAPGHCQSACPSPRFLPAW